MNPASLQTSLVMPRPGRWLLQGLVLCPVIFLTAWFVVGLRISIEGGTVAGEGLRTSGSVSDGVLWTALATVVCIPAWWAALRVVRRLTRMSAGPRRSGALDGLPVGPRRMLVWSLSLATASLMCSGWLVLG